MLNILCWVVVARLRSPLILEHMYTCVLAPGYYHLGLQLVQLNLQVSNLQACAEHRAVKSADGRPLPHAHTLPAVLSTHSISTKDVSSLTCQYTSMSMFVVKRVAMARFEGLAAA